MAEFDVVVLGGGLSGTRAALRAAELGGNVCIIEKEAIGRKGFIRRNILLSENNNENGKELYNWDDHLKEKQSQKVEV